MFFTLAAAPMLLGAIAVCPPPPARRHHCVVDGDTVWWQGEKIRIADIDTPELSGRCEAERRRARAARDRLVALLNARPVTIERTGTDRYGRTLARFRSRTGMVGEQLVSEGLAARWPGRLDWCAAR
jgi:endonuclease YncB( thermonuclease family)